MNYNENRLQFVHCDTLFATSEEAKAYIKGQLEEIDRPALYAEPMILKYGNVDSPNILIGMGSVGDGTTISTKNKTFFIDSAKMEEDIKTLFEEKDITQEAIAKIQVFITNIIQSCGIKADGTYEVVADDAILKNATSLYTADKVLSKFVQELAAKLSLSVKNGETVSLGLSKEDSGMTLTSEVILAPNKIVDSNVLPNIILHESNGIFTNIDLNYVAADAQLKLAINGAEKTLQLPQETHLVKGVYDEKIESLVLTFNREVDLKNENDEIVKSNKLVIDLGKLIEEWIVLGENSNTPIVLTREKVSNSEILANSDNERALNVWQDILKADVRISLPVDEPFNILKKDGTNRALFVDGRASNITYWKNGEKTNVQDALDSVECSISQSVGNIIFKRNDGIFAASKLTYDDTKNSLLFTTSTKDGAEHVDTIQLKTFSFLEGVEYDAVTEEIVVRYIDVTGKPSTLRIPVRGIIEEWTCDNTNTTVTLTKERVTAGPDVLKANVNIASGTQDNILEVRGHALYVNGTAENIRFSGTSTVFDEILAEQNRAKASETTITNALTAESTRAINAEGQILAKVHEETDRATIAETALDTKVINNANTIADEVIRAKAEELRIDTKVSAEITRATAAETAISNKANANADAIAAEIVRATAKEIAIDGKLDVEVSRAKAEETRIETKLDGEIALSLQNDTKHTADVKTVTDGLTAEIARAKTAEIANATKIDTTATALANEVALSLQNDAKHTADIKTVTDGLESEVDRAIAKETAIETKVNANTLALTNEIALAASNNTRLTADVKTVTDGLTAEISRAKIAEIAIDGKVDTTATALANEIARATNAEKLTDDKTNNNTTKIDGEIARAVAAESVLRQSITDVKAENSFVVNNTGTFAFEKVNSPTGSVLSGKVIVATTPEHNLINSDGTALFASVSLDYDEVSNTLKFATSDGTDKDIKLNAGSIIDKIVFDAETEEMVIMYTDANGGKQEVRFSVRTLFNQWGVADTNPGAVKLVKTIGLGSTLDILSAEVIITNMPSGNLLSNVGGSLYVSNQAKDIILANGDTVEESIKNINNGLTQEINNRIEGDINLQIQIDELSGKTKDYDAAIKALQDTDIVHNTQIDSLNVRVNEIKANDAQQDIKILAIQQDNILIKEEQKLINERLDNVEEKNLDQDAAILEAQKDIDNLELKTNIVTLETLSVKMEYNSTINSSNIKANTKISNNPLNLVVINKASDAIDDGGNGLLFDGSIDYGTF